MNTEVKICTFCHGEGKVYFAGHLKTCPFCKGTGHIIIKK